MSSMTANMARKGASIGRRSTSLTGGSAPTREQFESLSEEVRRLREELGQRAEE
jgi:hypothetical protein